MDAPVLTQIHALTKIVDSLSALLLAGSLLACQLTSDYWWLSGDLAANVLACLHAPPS